MNRKSLIKNSIYNVFYKALNVFFPLVTATYVSRRLLAAGVGQVFYAQNIAQYFITLAALGIPNYGIREIAKTVSCKVERDKIFNELFLINFLSSVFFSLLYYILICTVPAFIKMKTLHLVAGISICLNVFNVDWFYQGVEEYRYIAFRSFFIKFISLILIFLFINDEKDMVAYAVIHCIATGGNYIWNIFHLQKYKIKFSFNNIDYKKHIKPIMILLASVISIELYTLLDTTMLGLMCKTESVGYYSNSMKLVRLLITLVTAIGGVLLPRLSQYHIQGLEEKCTEIVSKVFSIMLFIFLPAEMGLYCIANQVVVVLFGPSFAEAGVTLKIASFLICTLGFSNLFGTQILLTYGKEQLLLITTVVGAIVNLTLNFILIPQLAQNGAAIASVLSESIVTLLSYVFAKRYIKLRISRRYFLITVISCVIMISVVNVVMRLINNNMLIVIISVALGVMVYSVINITLKNPIVFEIIDMFKNKYKS